MRCKACDKRLSAFESTRKYAGTTKYVDLCNSCFAPISKNVEVQVNYNLFSADDADDDFESTEDER